MGFNTSWSDTEGAVSEWNEAMFKMRRLDKIQTEINISKMNPLGKHIVTNEWNYIVWFNSINNLYGEGESKYKKEEKEIVKRMRELIIIHLRFMPPMIPKKVNVNGKLTVQFVLHQNNWDTLRKLLDLMESEVKLYNDKHGLSTKNTESMDGRSILR